MNIKICLTIFASAFVLMIVSAIIGNILEANGTLNKLSPNVTTAVMIFYFALFCVLGFFIVPLALRFFISAQIKIGNGELFLVKWLQAHEVGTVIGVWIFLLIGLCMAIPSAIKDGMFE